MSKLDSRTGSGKCSCPTYRTDLQKECIAYQDSGDQEMCQFQGVECHAANWRFNPQSNDYQILKPASEADTEHIADVSKSWTEITLDNYKGIRMNANCMGDHEGSLIPGDWVGYYDEKIILYIGLGGFRGFTRAWVDSDHIRDAWTKPHYIGRIKIDSEPTPELKSQLKEELSPGPDQYEMEAREWAKRMINDNYRRFLDICTRKGFDIEYVKRNPMLYTRITRNGVVVDVLETPHLEIPEWPNWANWAAMDGGGDVRFYHNEPEIIFEGEMWYEYYGDEPAEKSRFRIHGDLDWHNSLVKRPEEE